MRALLVLVTLAFAVTAIPTSAQDGQPYVTATVTGPSLVYPGSDATFDVSVEIDGPQSDLYITWSGPGGELCCDYVNSTVVSGQANLVGPGPMSVRWSTFGPQTTIRLVLHIHETLQAGPVTIGGYLPGTNVGQYLTLHSWDAQVATFPRTGGPPATDEPTTPALVWAGLALLITSGACFAATRHRNAARPPGHSASRRVS